MPLIAPALLAADFACLGEALGIIEAAGCRMVHLDVGDGHFARVGADILVTGFAIFQEGSPRRS